MSMDIGLLINVSEFHKDRLKDHVAIIHENVLKFARQARCNEVKLGLIRSISAALLQIARVACGVLPV